MPKPVQMDSGKSNNLLSFPSRAWERSRVKYFRQANE